MLTDYMMIAVISVFVAVAITANSFALYCILSDVKRQKTLVKELLLLLTCADLSASLCVPILHLIVPSLHNPPFAICVLTGLSQTFFSLFATGIGVLMACERFVALALPYWYYQHMFHKRVRIPVVVLTMLIAVICILPSCGIGSVHRITVRNGSKTVTCGVFPREPVTDTTQMIFPLLYSGSGCLFTTFSIIINISVVKILYSMRHKMTPPAIVRIEREMNVKSTKFSQEFVLTKMVFLLSLSNLICLTPLNLELILQQVGITISGTFRRMSHTLHGFNTITDPIINITIRKKYRSQIKAIVCCKQIVVNDNDSSNFKPSPKQLPLAIANKPYYTNGPLDPKLRIVKPDQYTMDAI